MKTGIVIQARMNSSRLPDKVLLDFYEGHSILEIIITRLKNQLSNHEIVVATSKNESDDLIERLVTDLDVSSYRGDESNVLGRFIETAKVFKFDAVIRICADNPFLLLDSIIKLIQKGEENADCDYISFKLVNEKPTIKTHIGLFGEWVKVSALQRIKQQTNNPADLEHVTSFIYTHPSDFKILLLESPAEVYTKLDLRFTVDTKEDFDISRKLYAAIKKGNGNWNLKDLILKTESDSEILSVMKKEIAKNEK